MKKIILSFLCVLLLFYTGYSQNDTTRNGDYPTRRTTTNETTNNPQYASIKRKIIRGFSFQAENDVFAKILNLKNEDKDYTGGFKFEFYTDYLAKGIFPFFMNRDDPIFTFRVWVIHLTEMHLARQIQLGIKDPIRL
ncbi:MAG: hypothetical protein GXC73_20170 [Chitinophagaceae bacterium]|nr:hypothetical protein [Chitinophagaceae bacterium]